MIVRGLNCLTLSVISDSVSVSSSVSALMYHLLFLLLVPVLCLKDTEDCHGYDCLKAYVEREEPAYKWRDLGHRLEVPDYQDVGGWTGYVLNFTSQTWLSSDLGEAHSLIVQSQPPCLHLQWTSLSGGTSC